MKRTTTNAFAGIIILGLTLALLAIPAPAAAEGTPELAPDHARTLAGVFLIERLALETPFLGEWTAVTLDEPLLVYDANGSPLYWEFPVMMYGSQVGRVAVAATSLYGSPGLSVTVGAPAVSVAERVDEAAQLFADSHPELQVLSAEPALVHDPVIAARIEYDDPDAGETAATFVDLVTMEEMEAGDGDAPGTPMIFSVQEFLERDHASERRELFWKEVTSMDDLARRYRLEDIDPVLRTPFTVDQWEVARDILVDSGLSTVTTRVVSGGSLKLIRQKKSDWCARAVAQMIEYYHFGFTPRTQAQIDSILNSLGWWSAPNPSNSVPWKKALVTYYRTYPLMIYSASVDELTILTATDHAKQEQGMKKLMAEIDADAPFSDNVYGHARMGMAYQVVPHNSTETRYYFGIYDPDNTFGGIRWELGWKDGMFGIFFCNNAPRHYPVTVRDFQILAGTP